MSTSPITVEQALQTAGVGKFQYRLFLIFGLVWMADAMQVLSIGFSAPSIAKTFAIPVPQALQTWTLFFVGMLVGAFVFGRLADRIGRRPVLMMAVVIDACFGVASAFAPDFTWLLALRFTPSAPEWHGYWSNPGDAGQGLKLWLDLPAYAVEQGIEPGLVEALGVGGPAYLSRGGNGAAILLLADEAAAEAVGTVLGNLVEALRLIAVQLRPFIPEGADRVAAGIDAAILSFCIGWTLLMVSSLVTPRGRRGLRTLVASLQFHDAPGMAHTRH